MLHEAIFPATINAMPYDISCQLADKIAPATTLCATGNARKNHEANCSKILRSPCLGIPPKLIYAF